MPRYPLSLLLTLTLISSAAGGQAPPDETPPASDRAPAARDVGPLEAPGDPPIVVPESERPTSAARLWRRGAYTSVQVNVDAAGMNVVGDAANEPSIAVDPGDPDRLAIGWRQFDTVESSFRQAGVGHSTDGGASWSASVIDPGVFRSDPVLGADSGGTFYYYSLTTGGALTCDVYESTDGGASWGPAVDAFGGDKAWIAIDRTGGLGAGHFYAAWSPGVGCCGDDRFNRSVDGAQSFEAPIPIAGQPVWGTIAVGPDGEVYLAGQTDTAGSFAVARSSTLRDAAQPQAFDATTAVDLGGEQRVFAGPNPGGLLGQVWVVVDPSGGARRGHVYLLASIDPPGADPLDVHFARSTDGGASWSAPRRINDDPVGNGAWQWFATLAVAPDGRLDAVWNDTRSDPGGFLSELYHARSTDGGLTWSPNQPLTPAFDPHLGWPQQEKLGDYYDMVSDLGGSHLAYAATFNGEQDVYYLHLPSGAIFSDGFETGDLTAWSGASGEVIELIRGEARRSEAPRKPRRRR